MGQPAVKERQHYDADAPVGEILRQARLHYNQSLEDIENALRIRASQIDAIETGQYHRLPGRVYAIGFVRSYAEYLGLDPEYMVGLFKAQAGGRNIRPQLQFPVAASESKIPQAWVVGASLVAAFIVIIFWWSMQSGDRSSVTEVPPVSKEIRQQEQAVQTAGPPAPTPEQRAAAVVAAANPAAPSAPSATTTAEKAAASAGIILNILENSWVEIKDSTGKVIVSRVLQAGDKYFVPDRPDLFISLGNSAGVQIEIDGKKLGALGAKGQVLRSLPLDAAELKKKYAAAE